MIEMDEIEGLEVEKNITQNIISPFIIKLHYMIQTEANICFLSDLLSGENLFDFLRYESEFDEYAIRYYAAELVLAIETLHNNEILYRNLVPESVKKKLFLILIYFNFFFNLFSLI